MHTSNFFERNACKNEEMCICQKSTKILKILYFYNTSFILIVKAIYNFFYDCIKSCGGKAFKNDGISLYSLVIPQENSIFKREQTMRFIKLRQCTIRKCFHEINLYFYIRICPCVVLLN